MFYSERHHAPQAGRLAPLSSFPGSHTPHLSVKSPQPWTLSGSTCASLVHIHFRLRLAERALGYLLLCCMLLWLMKGFVGVFCFQTVGKPGLGTGSGICSFHPRHPASVRSPYYFLPSVNYPAFHPCGNCPQFHKHAFIQCATQKINKEVQTTKSHKTYSLSHNICTWFYTLFYFFSIKMTTSNLLAECLLLLPPILMPHVLKKFEGYCIQLSRAELINASQKKIVKIRLSLINLINMDSNPISIFLNCE